MQIKKSFLSGLFFFVALFGGFLFFNTSGAYAATLYYNNAASDNDWNSLGSWWTDAGFTVQALSLPGVADDVVITTDVFVNNGPEPTIHSLTTAGATGIVVSMTVLTTATFNGSCSFQTSLIGQGIFNERSSNQGNIVGNTTFNGRSQNLGPVTGDAVFNGASINNNTVDGDAVFSDTSANLAAVTGTATFNYAHAGVITIAGGGLWGNGSSAANLGDDAQPITEWVFIGSGFNQGSFTGNATFSDTSVNQGSFTGNATFNDASINMGSITGNVTFNDISYSIGIVSGTATYGYATGGTITIADGGQWGSGTAGSNEGADHNPFTFWVFNGFSANTGTVTGDATFNDISYNGGTVTGTATYGYATGGTITIADGGRWGFGTAGSNEGADHNPLTLWVFEGASSNQGVIDGNAIFEGNYTRSGTVNGTKTRQYTSDAATNKDFISDGPWTVIADDAAVNIHNATYDSDPESPTFTVFQTVGTGSFSTETPVNIGNLTEELIPNEFQGGGVAQGWHGDDEDWKFTLPFAFPFYGNEYTDIKVNSNGSICLLLGSNCDSRDDPIEDDQSTPFISALGDDLRTDINPGDDIYITESSTEVTFRWQAIDFSDHNPINFEVVLNRDGSIKFNYGDQPFAPLRDPATVGISNSDGVSFAASTYNGEDDFNQVQTSFWSPVKPPVDGQEEEPEAAKINSWKGELYQKLGTSCPQRLKITIKGGNFSKKAVVRIGGTRALSVNKASNHKLTANFCLTKLLRVQTGPKRFIRVINPDADAEKSKKKIDLLKLAPRKI